MLCTYAKMQVNEKGKLAARGSNLKLEPPLLKLLKLWILGKSLALSAVLIR